MKAVTIVLLAAIAMASAQGVNIVDNPGPTAGQVNVVEQPGGAVGQPNQGVDPGFYLPSAGNGGNNGDIVNPDPGFYQGGNANPQIQNPVDPGFYMPMPGITDGYNNDDAGRTSHLLRKCQAPEIPQPSCPHWKLNQRIRRNFYTIQRLIP
ncbi:uncharacterized protein LOC125234536 isoform X2 [Leguminivora glycinivorella]|uniref:uncharacterized protein LOC125234536 isoform X2 n=1 Tax=Leguminivora glycinivorella TaxID=1035111 RepID=UPI00200CC950|nr:uncharacterized protein LOC125234536 isoform X2 [Leguminivora glycinivorella]